MIRKLKFLVYVVLGALTLSCSDWLKVSSEDRIMENDLFRTPRGFMTDCIERYLYRLVEFQSVRENFDMGNVGYFGTILYLPGEGP